METPDASSLPDRALSEGISLREEQRMRGMALETETSSTVDCLAAWTADIPAKEQVGFRLWDGTLWPDTRPRAATLVLKHPGALHEMTAAGTAIGLAEAYLGDDFDVEGDLEAAVEFAIELQNQPRGWLSSFNLLNHFRHLPNSPARRAERQTNERKGQRHSLERDRGAVSFHYDVSNEFYQLWLDEAMVYSCGYFTAPDRTLAQAQTAKLDYVCRKLRLRPGQRLLDIGCGWGGLALYAAQHYGVRVTGVTLSTKQAEFATWRVRAAGLGSQVTIALKDYRELDTAAQFDAVVSVGMAEHVGREKLGDYFATVAKLLKPGGVFLNHAIAEGSRGDRFRGASFVDAYVFPDGDIPPVTATVKGAEDAKFEVRDLENLREHYTLTLRHWVRRLEAAHDRALRFVDERTYRTWRLYMAGSAQGFDHGDLGVYQTLLVKLPENGRINLPLTREDWYRRTDSGEPPMANPPNVVNQAAGVRSLSR